MLLEKQRKNDVAMQRCWDNAQRLDRIVQEKIGNETRASKAGSTGTSIIPEPEGRIVDKTGALSVEEEESGSKDRKSKRERDRERAKRSKHHKSPCEDAIPVRPMGPIDDCAHSLMMTADGIRQQDARRPTVMSKPIPCEGFSDQEVKEAIGKYE